jgi:hypothetical protein
VLVEEIKLYHDFARRWYAGYQFTNNILVQYGVSYSNYNMKQIKYYGVNFYGQRNSSLEKSRTLISSGRTVQHTIEIGYTERIRLGFWWETHAKQKMAGINLIFSSAVRLFSPYPNCINKDNHKNYVDLWSYRQDDENACDP